MAEVTVIRNRRRFGAALTLADGAAFTFDATTDEQATDEGRLTEHPVETGVKTSDHFQVLPVSLTMTCEISRAPIQDDADDFGGGDGDRDVRAYERLRQILKTGEPLTIVTAIRTYPNMVLKKISQSRGTGTGQKINPQLEFKELVYATAEYVQIPASILAPRRRRSASSKKDKGAQQSTQADTANPNAAPPDAAPSAAAENRKDDEGRGASTLAGLL